MDPHLREGDTVPTDLTSYWKEVNNTYRALTEGKLQFRCIRWLFEHIIDSGYAKHLFPGTSIYNLLVSLPVDGKVSYTRTLQVAYDELEQVVTMQLKVGSNSQETSEDIEKSIVCSITCQPTEVLDTFEHFLNEHSDWAKAARQN